MADDEEPSHCYQVLFSKRARKEAQSLPSDLQERVIARLQELERDPFDHRISKSLKNAAGFRSARVGDWRIIYLVDKDLPRISVDRIEHRREVYKSLD